MAPKFSRLKSQVHVWGAMLDVYEKYRPRPKNISELKLALQPIRNYLPQDPTLSFTKRLRACIKANGGHFKYLMCLTFCKFVLTTCCANLLLGVCCVLLRLFIDLTCMGFVRCGDGPQYSAFCQQIRPLDIAPVVKYQQIDNITVLHCYAALLPRRGPHIASHSVCPSVCLSVRPVIVAIGNVFSSTASVTDVLFDTH